MKIRSKILFLQLYRKFQRKVKKSSLTPFEIANNIALLINMPLSGEEQISIGNFIKKLRNDGKPAQIIEVYKKDKPTQLENGGNSFAKIKLDRKDFSATGLPRSIELKNFLKTDFHYLIFCNPKSDIKNASIAGLSNSYCIVGPYSERKTPGYDFIINNTNSLEEYFESIYNSLKQIR